MIILASLLFGFAGVFNVITNLPAITQSFYRFLIATIVIFLIALLKNNNLRINKADTWKVILIGFFTFVTAYSVNEAVLNIEIGPSIFIMYLAPIIVCVLAPIFLKEKKFKYVWLSIFIALSGIFLITLPWDNTNIRYIGYIWASISSISFSAIIMISRSLSEKYSAVTSTFWRTSLSFIFILPFFIYSSKHIVSVEQLGIIAAMSILVSVLATIIFFYGIKKVSSQDSSIILYLEPVASIIYARIFLNQDISPLNLLGISLIIIAVYILYREQKMSVLKK